MYSEEITRPGIHLITEPIRLSDGTHLCAQPGARLVGGKKAEITEAGNGVYVCDLAALGIDPAPFLSRGFDRPYHSSHNGLYQDGRPMTLARYPKKGYIHIPKLGGETKADGPYVMGKLSNGVYCDDDRPAAWDLSQEIWAFGYWSWDWNPTRERFVSFDREEKFAKFVVGDDILSVGGQRFYCYNIREELTEPGEYVIDYAEKKIYLRPYEGTDPEKAEFIVSDVGTPAFALDGAKDIVIEGFRMEAFRGIAMSIKNCENVTVRGCEICNTGYRGVCVENSSRVSFIGCHIHDTGAAGISMHCGDRKTLTSADCTVEYCHIHNVALWDRCYEPPVSMTGVGMTCRYNKLHDCPHNAVLYHGNEIKITDNEIYRVVLETGDSGAIYSGRNYTCRGNEVCRNFLHHIGSDVGMGTMGIYNDDCLSGTKMNNNVFYKVKRAVFMGGGIDFIVDGNVFVDCYPAIEIDGRGQSDDKMWRNNVINNLYRDFYHIEGSNISGMDEPFISRYPELAKIDAYYKADRAPHIPPEAAMTNNIFCSDQKINYTWCTENGKFLEENNIDVKREELYKYLTPDQFRVIMTE